MFESTPQEPTEEPRNPDVAAEATDDQLEKVEFDFQPRTIGYPYGLLGVDMSEYDQPIGVTVTDFGAMFEQADSDGGPSWGVDSGESVQPGLMGFDPDDKYGFRSLLGSVEPDPEVFPRMYTVIPGSAANRPQSEGTYGQPDDRASAVGEYLQRIINLPQQPEDVQSTTPGETDPSDPRDDTPDRPTE
jgi:hypothetical protein